MKRITILLFTVFALVQGTFAQTITNGDNSVLPGTSGFMNYAFLTSSSTQNLLFTVTRTGWPIVQSPQYSLDFINWTASTFRLVSSGQHNWNMVGTVPSNTPCGAAETYTIKFYNTLGQLVSTNSYVITVPASPTISINGPASFCNLTGGTYTVQGNQTGTGTFTWNCTNTNYRINGVSFPLTTTTNSAFITTTIVGQGATISVTANGVSGICGQFNVPTKVISSVSTALSMYGPDCIAPHTSGNLVATPAGTSGYQWQASSDNVNWITMPNVGSTVSQLFQTPGTYYFRVRRTFNGCQSAWVNWTTFCTTSGAACRGKSPNFNATSELNETREFNVYPNPSTGIFHLTSDQSGTAKVYDLQGKLFKSFEVHENENDFDLSMFENGIYFLVLTDANGEGISKQRIVINK